MEIVVTLTNAWTLLFGIRKDASIFHLTAERVRTCEVGLVLVFPIFTYSVVMAKSLCPLILFPGPCLGVVKQNEETYKSAFEL